MGTLGWAVVVAGTAAAAAGGASGAGSPLVTSTGVSVFSVVRGSCVEVSSVKPARAFCTRPEVVFSKNEERSSRSSSPSPELLGIAS